MDPVQAPVVFDPLSLLLDDLVRQGWSVQPGFFPAELTDALSAELHALSAAVSAYRTRFIASLVSSG